MDSFLVSYHHPSKVFPKYQLLLVLTLVTLSIDSYNLQSWYKNKHFPFSYYDSTQFLNSGFHWNNPKLFCGDTYNPLEEINTQKLLVVPPNPYPNENDIVDNSENKDFDIIAYQDIDNMLKERAKKFYDNKNNINSEKCILVAVELKSEYRRIHSYQNINSGSNTNTNNENSMLQFDQVFTLKESIAELCELVSTAGLKVNGFCVQKLDTFNTKTYIGSGKIAEIVDLINTTGARTIVFDDDLTPKQQRNLEDSFQSYFKSDENNIKILDRTAIILEIFASHANSREGQLQVELAMLEYRLTRGPRDNGGDSAKGCGFRGPGESRIETDKRVIKDKIVLLKKEIMNLDIQRKQHRQG
eukprot:gene14175-19020_t